MVKFPRIYIRRSTALCLTVFFWMLSVDVPVDAQQKSIASRKNIAIVGFQHGVHRDNEKRVYQEIRNRLQAEDGFQVLDSASVNAEMTQSSRRSADTSSGKIQAAYEHFVQGVEYYRTLDLTQAIRELNRAVKDYREGIASLQDNHYLLYAHLYLGMALYFDGQKQEGEKFIREMIKLDVQRKTRKLPLRDFPPKIVEVHKQQSLVVKKMPSGNIYVDSTPSSAKVMLDGMDVGETPVALRNVPVGEHFIAIDQAGHRLYKKLLDVKVGDQNIIAKLTSQKMFMAKNPFEQDNNQEQTRVLKKAAQELGVSYFILGQITAADKTSEIQLQSYDVMAGRYSSVFVGNVSGKPKKVKAKVGKTVDNWLDAVVKKASVPVAGPIDFQKDFREPNFNAKPKGEKSFLQKNMLWLGLGVLAAGVGGYFLLSGPGDTTSNVLRIDNPLN